MVLYNLVVRAPSPSVRGAYPHIANNASRLDFVHTALAAELSLNVSDNRDSANDRGRCGDIPIHVKGRDLASERGQPRTQPLSGMGARFAPCSVRLTVIRKDAVRHIQPLVDRVQICQGPGGD
jgi:hypothetical protein